LPPLMLKAAKEGSIMKPQGFTEATMPAPKA